MRLIEIFLWYFDHPAGERHVHGQCHLVAVVLDDLSEHLLEAGQGVKQFDPGIVVGQHLLRRVHRVLKGIEVERAAQDVEVLARLVRVLGRVDRFAVFRSKKMTERQKLGTRNIF